MNFKQYIILLEMAQRLTPEQTGVSRDIWVSSSDFEGKNLRQGHPRRIKVKSGPGPKDWASVSFDTKRVIEGDLPSSVIKEVELFIVRNYIVLARIWERGTDSEKKLLKKIRKIN